MNNATMEMTKAAETITGKEELIWARHVAPCLYFGVKKTKNMICTVWFGVVALRNRDDASQPALFLVEVDGQESQTGLQL